MAKKQSQQVNDLIFRELIKRGYSLEGNTRIWDIADSKLWYLTSEQAESYLELENSKGYKDSVVNSEFTLIEENIEEILSGIGEDKVNVVDLGCGDGEKGSHVVEHLIKKGISVRYCPIDISGYMVKKAIQTVSKLDIEGVIESQFNISDFENLENITPLLREGEYKRSVFLLLGYTLGNFEIHDILYQIRSAMKGNDLLLIIDGLENSKWEERADSAKKDLKTDSFFGLTALQLGLKKSEIEFGSRYKNSRIEFYYTIKINKVIDFQNRKVEFNKGDQIIIAVAYKHNKGDLLTSLNMYFDEVTLKLSKDESTGLALCKK
jgi:uncharacterized SAM-dependent methyltransferase